MNCSICLEDIGVTNCTLTECGHSFHSSCLMKNVAYNGFGCPYCRTEMAEEQGDDDEDEDEDEYELEYENHMLRGFRFFNNAIEGVENDEEDIERENEIQLLNAKPSVAHIAQKLAEDGITMEQFVQALLKDHEDYGRADSYREYSNLFQKIDDIVVNYQE